MKKLSKAFALAILLLNTTYVFGDEGLYISSNLGVGIAMDEELKIGDNAFATTQPDTGFAVTTAVGYIIDNIRIETEVAYQENKITSLKADNTTVNVENLKINAISILTNVYYDFKNSSSFTPYVGGGIGFAYIEYTLDGMLLNNPYSGSDSDSVFAYQAGLGVDYAINDQVTFGINYRYMGTTEQQVFSVAGENVTSAFASNNIYVGMRYKF